MNRRCRSLAEDIGLSRAKAVRFEGIMAGSEGRADSVRTLLHRSREELFELIWAEAPERDAIMEIGAVPSVALFVERVRLGAGVQLSQDCNFPVLVAR